ncbi:MAG: response regulator [Deltaproteobacteria bacterium]|nr:response regulator [Deltaproteobacteria bacterium]
MTDKSIRRKVEAIKRKKITSRKVVSLADFRELKAAIDTRVILVVDDDEVMRSALKRILVAEGYRVFLAEDGLELSKVLETTRLDMVLLDVNLPWVDGFELCRLIKGHHSLKDVPLILVSARKDQVDVEKGFDVGADDYLTKPFDIDYMLNVINRRLLTSVS